jgi:hypothetical protein
MDWLRENGVAVLAILCATAVAIAATNCMRDVRLAEADAKNVKSVKGHKFKFGITKEQRQSADTK